MKSIFSHHKAIFIVITLISLVSAQKFPSLNALTTCNASNPTACFIRRAIECKACYNGNMIYTCTLFANELYRKELTRYSFGKLIETNIPEAKFQAFINSSPDRLDPFCIGFNKIFISGQNPGLDIGENYTIASEGVSVTLEAEIEKLTNIAVSITTTVLFSTNIPNVFPSSRISARLSTTNRRLVGSQRLPTFSEHTIRSSKGIREGAIVKVVRKLPNLKGWKRFYIKNINGFRVIRISNRLYILYVPFNRKLL